MAINARVLKSDPWFGQRPALCTRNLTQCFWSLHRVGEALDESVAAEEDLVAQPLPHTLLADTGVDKVRVPTMSAMMFCAKLSWRIPFDRFASGVSTTTW